LSHSSGQVEIKIQIEAEKPRLSAFRDALTTTPGPGMPAMHLGTMHLAN
jgi:hypothetical protein